MQTAAELIDEKGAAAIADAVKLPVETVRVWKSRRHIPRRRWPEITAAFPDITTERLLQIEKAA